MKISKYILIGVIAFVVGLTGLIICLVPSQSGADSVVSKYVSAINSGNINNMKKCILSPADIGLDLDIDIDIDSGSESSGDKVLDALDNSQFDFNSDGVKKVKSVKLVGCVDGETEVEMNMQMVEVTAVVEITYENQDGDEKTVFDQESFSVIKSKKGYKIAD